MKESDQHLPIAGVIDRLSALADSGIIEAKWEKVLDELLLGLYPGLSSTELCVCRWIIYTIWDLDQNEALYDVVVLRVMHQHYEFFQEEKEVENTIVNLCIKGIVYSKVSPTEWSWVKSSSRIFTLRLVTASRYLGLLEIVRDDAIAAMGECLKSALDAHLKPM